MDTIKKIAVVFVICVMYACENDIIYNASETFSEMPVIEVYIDDDEYLNLLRNKTTKSDAPVKIFYNGQAKENMTLFENDLTHGMDDLIKVVMHKRLVIHRCSPMFSQADK